MSSILTRYARAATRRPGRTTVAGVLAALLLIAGAIAAGGAFTDDFDVPGIESQRAQDVLADRFPAQAGDSATLVLTTPDGRLDEEARKSAIARSLEEIARQPHVEAVTPGARDEQDRTALTTIHYDATAAELGAGPRARLEAATAPLSAVGVRVAMSGLVIDEGNEGEVPVGEIIGVVLALVLLVAILRAVRAALTAIGLAVLGVGVGFGLLLLAALGTEVPTLAPTLAAMLGLGAGIDYALLLASRQQEELRAGHTPSTAAATASATAGLSALTAAGIVLVSISGLVVTGIPFVGRVGIAAGVVVLAAALLVVAVLPAALASLGRHALPRPARRAAGASSTAARRLRGPQAFALRRPKTAIALAGGVLALLAAPAVVIEFGQPDDGNLAPDQTQRQAYDAVAAAFGAGTNGPLLVAVAAEPGASVQAAAQRARTAVGQTPGVASVAPAVVNPAGDTALLTAIPETAPQDGATADLVRDLRRVLPRTLEGVQATAQVGGPTARFVDEAERIAARTPVFALTVVGLSVLLLLLAFRSWRVAVMSAVLNLLSIAVAFGVITLAFQTGPGAALLGVEEQPVIPYVPLFVFAILFGLSTDYNVFLLSRVREEYERERSMPRALAAAGAQTGRVIAAAGAVMVVVFLGFATDPDATIKMTGIGLASAIVVDVTLIRLVLAPALMTLLGDRVFGSATPPNPPPSPSPSPSSNGVAGTRAEVLRASPRMFESAVLDRLSRVHPAVPPVIFVPVIALLTALGVQRTGVAAFVALAVVGYVLWTLTEYWLHRLVFHFEPDHGLGARLHWIIHGVHHDHPSDPLRLVMPPSVSVPLALLVFGAFVLVLGGDRAPAVAAGFITGYLVYDMTHFALHHHTPRSRVGRALREAHMRHHFQDDTTAFGVSAPYWDRVFGTAPRRSR